MPFKRFAEAALNRTGADLLAIRIEERTKTSVHYMGKELEHIGTQTDLSASVRACVNGGWGFATCPNPADLPVTAERAIAMAKAVSGRGTHLKDAPFTVLKPLEVIKDDPRCVSLEEKESLCRKYNGILIAPKEVVSTNVRYEDRCRRQWYYDSDGGQNQEEELFCGIALMAVAADGNVLQQGYESIGDLRGYTNVVGLEELAEKVARRAVDLLRAEPAKAGTYTVIIDPLLGGIFAHEAFGHLSEADFLYENPRLLEIMSLGREFGKPELAIIDDATLPSEAGSYSMDDEGVAGQRTTLIREGRLVGRLHSRETAAVLDEPPTGNGRALNALYSPIVRMSNTFIETGSSSLEEMLAETDRGIYARGALAGMTNCEMFTFTAQEAFVIEKGKLSKKLRDVVLTGNVFQTLANIDRFGNDLKFHGGLGGCGKGGQMPLRVSCGSPHLRIREVVIGGV